MDVSDAKNKYGAPRVSVAVPCRVTWPAAMAAIRLLLRELPDGDLALSDAVELEKYAQEIRERLADKAEVEKYAKELSEVADETKTSPEKK